jgi:uncharacterized membrane protein
MPRWLLYSLVSIVLWGAWGLIGKATTLNALFLTALSAIGVVAVAIPLLFLPGLKQGSSLRRGMAFAFATGIFGNLGNLALLQALKLGEASAVQPFVALYPLVTVALAFLLLKERLNRVQGLGFLGALGAIVLFGYVTAGAEEGKRGAWMLWAAGTVLGFGIAAVTQKIATNFISNELSLVCFAASFVPVTAIILACSGPYDWKLPGVEWVYMLLYGAGIGLGTLTLFAAYRWGNASIVTAITGLYPALTVILAVPLFKESLGTLKVVAIVLALAAGTALTYEKKPQDA